MTKYKREGKRQEELVLQHILNNGHKISHITAMQKYGIESLSSVIARLKKEGYQFAKRDITSQKDGNIYHNVIYTLINPKQEEKKDDKDDTVLIKCPRKLNGVIFVPKVDDNVKSIRIIRDENGMYKVEEEK